MEKKPSLFIGLRHDYMKYFSKDSPRVRLAALAMILGFPALTLFMSWLLWGR